MKDKTDELIEMVELAGQTMDDTRVVTDVRELWNWQRDSEDVDVEIRLGPYADLINILQRIEEAEEWTVRFCDTTDSDAYKVSLAVIYHEPEPTPEGTMFFEEL